MTTNIYGDPAKATPEGALREADAPLSVYAVSEQPPPPAYATNAQQPPSYMSSAPQQVCLFSSTIWFLHETKHQGYINVH